MRSILARAGYLHLSVADNGGVGVSGRGLLGKQ